jgi:hypothetical protein
MSPEELSFAYDSITYNFPNLQFGKFQVTSPCTEEYNCIAWAANDSSNWWWPGGKYWPGSETSLPTIKSFTQAFAGLGYIECDTDDLEAGYEKIALYIDVHSFVTHASRQLKNGRWTSKLGRSWDITHELDGVCGPAYGVVGKILKRPI